MHKSILILSLLIFTLNGCQHRQIPSQKISVDSLSMKFLSENSFKGIVEAFQHSESQGGRVIIRSQPSQRSGLYFNVKFNHSLSLLKPGMQVKVSFITENSPKEQSHTWIVPDIKHSLIFQNELYLGITDDSNFSSNTQLIAWCIEVFDGNNNLITSQKSFAW